MALLGRFRRRPAPGSMLTKGITPGDARDLLHTASAGWSYSGGVGRLFSGEKSAGALAYPSLAGLDFFTLRQRSREAVWDSPQGASLLKRRRDNVVNSGCFLVASPLWDLLGESAPKTLEEREKLRREIELRYHVWANSTDPDARGERTLYQIQGDEFGARDEDGESIVVLRYAKDPTLLSPVQLQFVDPDQLVLNRPATLTEDEVRDGVELDKIGSPVAVHIRDPFSGKDVRIPYFGDYGRRFVLHPKRITRPGQHRGVPELSGIIHELSKLTDYSLAELEAAAINAKIALVTLTEQGAKPSKVNVGVQGRTTAPTSSTLAATDGPKHYEMRDSGLHIFPGAGNTIQSFDTKRPNVNFGKFQQAFFGTLAAARGIPYEVAIESFNQNYSASRACLVLFWNLVESERQDSAALFWNPVYEAWFREEVRAGRISAPGFGTSPLLTRAWLNCDWAGIRMPDIDPLKSANAAHQRIADGLTTHDREAKLYNGSDFGDNAKRLATENALLREAGLPEATAPAATPIAPDLTEDQPAQPAGEENEE